MEPGDEDTFVSNFQTRKNLSEAELKIIENLDLEETKEAIESLKHNLWVKLGLPSRDPKSENFRRMGYVRYITDFIISFTGSKVEAENIRDRIQVFLKEELQLKINEAKSYISHSSDKGITYLGYYIRYLPFNKIIVTNPDLSFKSDSKHRYQLKTTILSQIQLKIPIELILRRAVMVDTRKFEKVANPLGLHLVVNFVPWTIHLLFNISLILFGDL
jgi:hypothetical protein